MSVPLQTPSKNVEQWNWAQMYKIPPDILDDLCRFVTLICFHICVLCMFVRGDEFISCYDIEILLYFPVAVDLL
jgi:hypothetical protein